jgi:hypothetical protein
MFDAFVDGGGGLVEKDQAWAVYQDAGKAEALLLTRGQDA